MSISFRLDDKLILVTGASSGIGQSIAIEAAAAGARVLLLGRNEERLQQTADRCEGRGIPVPCSLDDLDALPKRVRNLAKEHGPLSGLVHSAGIAPTIPLRALKAARIRQVFDLNAIAGVMLVKGLIARGAHTQPASCVFLSSIGGRIGTPSHTAYCMSKGAVEQATKVLAIELQAEGIRVNAIAPSLLRTPMLSEGGESTMSEETIANLLETMPGGLGEPEDAAAAAIYLLSDASKFVTGTSLLVDGGYCAK